MSDAIRHQPGRKAAEVVLRSTVATRFSGRVDITSAHGELARVWFADGVVLAAAVPGPRPRLGVRLLSAGLLQPEDLDAALREQAASVNPEPLGVILVRRGAIDRAQVDHVARVQLVDQIADLLGWELVGAAQFSGDHPSAALDQPMPVEEVIRLARARLGVWEGLVGRMGGAHGVPKPSMLAAPRANLLLGSYDWAVLMKVNGVRSLESLASDCGLSIYETAQIVDALANVGLVVLPMPGTPTPQRLAARSPSSDLGQGPGLGTPQAGPQRRPAVATTPLREAKPEAVSPGSQPGGQTVAPPAVLPTGGQTGSQAASQAGPTPSVLSAPEVPPESDADARRRANVDTAALLKELSALNRSSGTD